MSIMLATLCLNEMEWLPKLYEQHKDWPEMAGWVFVEAADQMYAQANPELVSPEGLSVDGTSAFLAQLAATDPRVTYIPHGFSTHPDPAQGKVASRQRYLEVADELNPDFVFVVDADEFYTKEHQAQVLDCMKGFSSRYWAFRFRQREIWRPPSIAGQPLFHYEAVGGVWSVPHCRGWKWAKGLRYSHNHNWLERPDGRYNTDQMMRFEANRHPQCIHLGFASIGKYRAAKNRYYEERGEGKTDHRQVYVDCRAAFETWKPGDRLPHGCQVLIYNGPVPEVFQ